MKDKYTSSTKVYFEVEAESSIEADCIVENLIKQIREIDGVAAVSGWSYPKRIGERVFEEAGDVG